MDFRILITHLKFLLAMESSVSPEVIEVLRADLKRDLAKAYTHQDKVDFIMDTIKAEMGNYPSFSRARIAAALSCITLEMYSLLSMDDVNFLGESANLEKSGGRAIWQDFFDFDYLQDSLSDSSESEDSTYDSEDDMVPYDEPDLANGIYRDERGFSTMWSM